jgi:hypothetical protein
MENITEHTIWTEYLDNRKARKVARALKADGYTTATIEKCTGFAIGVAQYFEPGDVTARERLLDIICQAAGIKPNREERTMGQLSLEEQARRRVNNTPELKAIESVIFYDWPNWDEHMLWVVLSPVETIIDWAQTVNTDA